MHPLQLRIVTIIKEAGGIDVPYSVIVEKAEVDSDIASVYVVELTKLGFIRRSNFVKMGEGKSEASFSLIPEEVAKAVLQMDELLQPLRV